MILQVWLQMVSTSHRQSCHIQLMTVLVLRVIEALLLRVICVMHCKLLHKHISLLTADIGLLRINQRRRSSPVGQIFSFL